MLYLSTVEAGGRTIFPKLGLSVAPEEGSLLYWHIRWPGCCAVGHDGFNRMIWASGTPHHIQIQTWV